jgi:Tfp pilus assembly protein PilF
MKKLILLSVILWGFFACTQSPKEKKMAITTSSEKALQLYTEAMAAGENYYMNKFSDLAKKSLEEDPDFFMANYMLAMFYLGSNDAKFRDYTNKAVNCKAKLSKEELMLKEALGKFLENEKADNTEIGKKLIEMFPNDVFAYETLMWFQYIIQDNPGMVKDLENAITVFDKHAPFYNMLGYSYMSLGQNDKALNAFNKYIELAPDIPNSYDSKGDYFMKVKDYASAYESYMKANTLDSLFSYKKALKAKAIVDSLSAVNQ